MKLIIGKRDFGKGEKFTLIAETDFEKSFLQERFLKSDGGSYDKEMAGKEYSLIATWGYENKLDLEAIAIPEHKDTKKPTPREG